MPPHAILHRREALRLANGANLLYTCVRGRKRPVRLRTKLSARLRRGHPSRHPETRCVLSSRLGGRFHEYRISEAASYAVCKAAEEARHLFRQTPLTSKIAARSLVRSRRVYPTWRSIGSAAPFGWRRSASGVYSKNHARNLFAQCAARPTRRLTASLEISPAHTRTNRQS